MSGLIDHPWEHNSDGFWCGSCGYLVAHPDAETLPETCRQCGFPDPEAVAEYHCGPWDGDDDWCEDDDDCLDDCGLMPDGQCVLAGTEFCDWECGRLG